MADTDLIVQIYPFNDPLYYVQKTINASSRFMPPRQPQQRQDPYGHSSRESTEALEEYNPETLPYIELRFSGPPRTSSASGTSPYKRTEINKRYHLIVRYLKSTNGTTVAYDRKGRDKRRSKFDWIVDGFDLPNQTKNLIVQLHQNLSFRIIVNHHDITSPIYIDNVERFRQGAANLQNLVSGFSLQSGPDTERNSGTQTSVKHSILLPLGRIGHGTYGVVSRH
ncbi:hypothetical protein F5883DRAFT_647083 [Diaporthe sp. PMI_573]|nr:hypothetical protein F5883DRAFT_647083 [Diaporthaceae sp. PMI_573]